MAIAYVTSTDGGETNGSPASKTFAHNNTATSANHCLVVCIYTYGANSRNDTVSGVTYNSTSMTRAKWHKNDDQDSAGSCYIYYLLNPSSGSNNVVISQSGTKAANLGATAGLYSGVDTTNPINVTGGAWSNSGNLTASATLTSASWLVGIGHINNTITSAGSGTTIRQPGGSTSYKYCDSNGELASGSRSLTLTRDSDNHWVMAIAALQVGITTITATLTDGINMGDVISAGKLLTATLTDGIKLGDVISSIRVRIATLIDGLKLGDLISSVILPITQWTNRTKPSTTFTNRTKPSTTFINRTKPNTTWTKIDKW